ncbi:MAG: hypothetical protein EHM72_16730 [Calditrichaeota bacterium]|nr:MAG: hypothetical protein EHM72_16730 [Calditrichota bacterium]
MFFKIRLQWFIAPIKSFREQSMASDNDIKSIIKQKSSIIVRSVWREVHVKPRGGRIRRFTAHVQSAPFASACVIR